MTEVLLRTIRIVLQVLTNMVHGIDIFSVISPALESMLNVMTYVVDLLRMINFIVPIDTIYQICLATISVNVLLWGIWIFNRIVRLFEGLL